jgi:hypothetical protein
VEPSSSRPAILVTAAFLALGWQPSVRADPGPPTSPVAVPLYTSARVAQALAPLHPETIGHSVEGRPILAVRLGTPGGRPKPALLALFGEHAEEHDTVSIAIDLVRRLAAHPPLAADLVVVPMLNPDAADLDLSGRVPPFTARRNLRDVNLNRNWGYAWDRPPFDHAGAKPFSEPETLAVRELVAHHPEITALVDFHSGLAPFSQGQVLIPFAYADHEALAPEERARLQGIGDRLAAELTDRTDPRPPCQALQSREVRGLVAAWIERAVPPAHQAQALAALPATTVAAGTSIDWAYGVLGLLAFGVELSRPADPPTPEAYAELYARRQPGLMDGVERFFRTLLGTYVTPKTRYIRGRR